MASLECRGDTAQRSAQRPHPRENRMADERSDSVTVWIESLKAGDAAAAEELWRRYFKALVHLARERLRGASRTVADEEDAALDAFDSFFRARLAAAILG